MRYPIHEINKGVVLALLLRFDKWNSKFVTISINATISVIMDGNN
jgi:hypothetical protein